MSKSLSALCMVLFLLVNLQGAANAAPQEQGAEFKSLFNGKDLTGWEGDPRLWSVKDGVIRGETTADKRTNKNTFLIWEGTASDFEMKITFRCNATNNSGIQYRSKRFQSDKTPKNKWRVKGYQHEIRNENTPPNLPGFIYDEGGKRGRICLAGEKAEWNDGKKKTTLDTIVSNEDLTKLVKVDDWNAVRIVAKGNHIQHYLNGKLILDFTDNHPTRALSEGIIALQLHHGKPMWVEFKDIMFRDLKSDSGSAKKEDMKGSDKKADGSEKKPSEGSAEKKMEAATGSQGSGKPAGSGEKK